MEPAPPAGPADALEGDAARPGRPSEPGPERPLEAQPLRHRQGGVAAHPGPRGARLHLQEPQFVAPGHEQVQLGPPDLLAPGDEVEAPDPQEPEGEPLAAGSEAPGAAAPGGGV